MTPRRTALAVLLAAAPASGYFAQVANAHMEFVAGSEEHSAETVDDRSSLQHAQSLYAALEGALAEKSELGYAAPKIMGLFEDWVGRFGREYESLEEKGRRMLVWLENHVFIETHNSKEAATFTMGHNDFSDLTHDEFLQRMKLGPYSPGLIVPAEGRTFNFMDFNEQEEEISNSRLRGPTEEAAAVARKLQAPSSPDAADDDDACDWHEKGLMGPIRNQGVCGACWAFSTIGSIESGQAIDKFNQMPPSDRAELVEKVGVGGDLGLVVPLSEQDLIDCDTLYEKGCQGGLMTTTFEEEEHKKGICSETDYPYLMTQGTCATDLCTPVPGSIVKNHIDITPRKTNALKEALKVKPVTVAIVANDPMFQFYKEGIFSVEGCGKVTKQMGEPGCQMLYDDQDTCLPDINHGVLAVGFGKDETVTTEPNTFFKVKNSWGEEWGEDGYFRLARWEEDKTDPMENWGECAILTLLSYPVMQ